MDVQLLEPQLEQLITSAPQDGSTPQLLELIVPVLRVVASRLQHPHYYIVQTSEQEWLMTTLSNRQNPQQEKQVVYAFPTLEDAAKGPHSLRDPRLMALPIPVTHLLFQMLSLSPVHSIIFFETPGNGEVGTEVQREEIYNLVQLQLHQTFGSSPTHLA